jgi:hypothetical protein
MSDSKSQPRRGSSAQPALQAAMSDAATDPVRRALWLDALEQQLRPCLPPALSPHCRLGNVTGGKLVFIVDSPVWHAKLRLAAPGLIDVARSIGLAATEVVARTATTTLPPDVAGRAAKPMSEASRNALKAALDSLDDSDAGNDAAEPGGASPGNRRGRQKR